MTNQKQFGVWMDLHHATVIGRDESEEGNFVVLANVKGEEVSPNSSEKTEHNHERTAEAKFFKEITSYLQNATYIHLTGTGVAQEKFMHYLADSAQFKNTKTEESTSLKMSDEKLIEYVVGKF
jgi:stalled ribosome rescue protein Dom34